MSHKHFRSISRVFKHNILGVPTGNPEGPSLLSQYFIGYRVTFAGSLIGFAYAFVCGFAGGYFIARMYNWIVGLRESKLQSHS